MAQLDTLNAIDHAIAQARISMAQSNPAQDPLTFAQQLSVDIRAKIMGIYSASVPLPGVQVTTPKQDVLTLIWRLQQALYDSVDPNIRERLERALELAQALLSTF